MCCNVCNSLSVKVCGHNRESPSLNVISTFSFHSLIEDSINPSSKCFIYISVVCPVPQDPISNTKLGSVARAVKKSSPEGNVAPNPRQWTPRSLTFEPVVRVALALAVVICRKTRDRQDGSLQVRGQFHKHVLMSHEGHSKNATWVAETQIFTPLSASWIKGIKRTLTSQRCSLNIGQR